MDTVKVVRWDPVPGADGTHAPLIGAFPDADGVREGAAICVINRFREPELPDGYARRSRMVRDFPDIREAAQDPISGLDEVGDRLRRAVLDRIRVDVVPVGGPRDGFELVST